MSPSVDAEEALIRGALEGRLSPGRIAHSEGVASLAAELCGRFGVPARPGFLAGLSHDIARELPAADWRALASRDGRPLSPDEELMPILLHGRAGAVLLAEELGVESPEVLEAVRDHVTGRPGMGTLSSIVYVADYLEPGRSFLADSERLAILAGGLMAMVREVTAGVVGHLERQGRPVARVARELCRWAEGEERADGSQAASG